MNSNDSTKNKRRYTPEEKQSVLDFIAERKTQNKRGAQKEAAERFGISTVTISSWMKASKAKRGRKPGTKNTTAPKTQPLAAAQPADLRPGGVLEEIADPARTAKLDALRAEAEELGTG
ncbi:MAG: hypothetical protein ACLT8E_11310 [Akkermansia sp.]